MDARKVVVIDRSRHRRLRVHRQATFGLNRNRKVKLQQKKLRYRLRMRRPDHGRREPHLFEAIVMLREVSESPS